MRLDLGLVTNGANKEAINGGKVGGSIEAIPNVRLIMNSAVTTQIKPAIPYPHTILIKAM